TFCASTFSGCLSPELRISAPTSAGRVDVAISSAWVTSGTVILDVVSKAACSVAKLLCVLSVVVWGGVVFLFLPEKDKNTKAPAPTRITKIITKNATTFLLDVFCGKGG